MCFLVELFFLIDFYMKRPIVYYDQEKIILICYLGSLHKGLGPLLIWPRLSYFFCADYLYYARFTKWTFVWDKNPQRRHVPYIVRLFILNMNVTSILKFIQRFILYIQFFLSNFCSAVCRYGKDENKNIALVVRPTFLLGEVEWFLMKFATIWI